MASEEYQKAMELLNQLPPGERFQLINEMMNTIIDQEEQSADIEMRLTSHFWPVRYVGKIDGKYFYFNALRDDWKFTIADTLEEAIHINAEEEGFYRSGAYFEASRMPFEEAERLIGKYIREYLAERLLAKEIADDDVSS